MNKKIPLLFTLLFLIIVAKAQHNISGYVGLKAEQFDEGDGKYVGVYPFVNQHPVDETGKQVLKYHRRFEYLLNNKTHFQGIYDHLYPDTVKINTLYTDSISRDQTFMGYFNQLIQPFTGKSASDQTFTPGQLMQVASRFFYCDGVRKDSTISSHICITLNGVKEAQWDKDFTILEAFVFEAIFENYYVNKDVKNAFVNNFVQYIKEGEKKFAGKDAYLLSVRNYAFEKMEKDAVLEAMLRKYYSEHRDSLPFRIVP